MPSHARPRLANQCTTTGCYREREYADGCVWTKCCHRASQTFCSEHDAWCDRRFKMSEAYWDEIAARAKCAQAMWPPKIPPPRHFKQPPTAKERLATAVPHKRPAFETDADDWRAQVSDGRRIGPEWKAKPKWAVETERLAKETGCVPGDPPIAKERLAIADVPHKRPAIEREADDWRVQVSDGRRIGPQWKAKPKWAVEIESAKQAGCVPVTASTAISVIDFAKEAAALAKPKPKGPPQPGQGPPAPKTEGSGITGIPKAPPASSSAGYDQDGPPRA